MRPLRALIGAYGRRPVPDLQVAVFFALVGEGSASRGRA